METWETFTMSRKEAPRAGVIKAAVAGRISTVQGATATVAVASGTPLIFAGIGELVTERSGILNLGVEGMMLAGAVMGFAVAVGTHSAWMGVAIAMLAGAVLALGHAVLAVTLRAEQVTAGLAPPPFRARPVALPGETPIRHPHPGALPAGLGARLGVDPLHRPRPL